jgi:hypothetical protein
MDKVPICKKCGTETVIDRGGMPSRISDVKRIVQLIAIDYVCPQCKLGVRALWEDTSLPDREREFCAKTGFVRRIREKNG